MSNDASVFKARYLDVLLLAVEAEVESGEVALSSNTAGHSPLCDRIEKCLDRWDDIRAPWLEHFAPLVEAKPSAVEAPAVPPPVLEPEPDEPDEPEQPEEPADEPEDRPWFAKPYQGPIKPRVIEAMAPGRSYSTEDIYELIDQKSDVGAAIGWMVKKGELVQTGDGRYELPSDGATAPPKSPNGDAPEPPPVGQHARKRSTPRPQVNPALAIDIEASVRRRAEGA